MGATPIFTHGCKMGGTELLLFSSLLSVAQRLASANSQARLASHDAQVAEQNAQLAEQQAEADAERKRRAVARALGQRRTSIGASGLTVEGSPLDLLEDLAAESELEVLGIRQQGVLRAREFRLAGRRSQLAAQGAQTQSILGAGSALSSGFGTFVNAKAKES